MRAISPQASTKAASRPGKCAIDLAEEVSKLHLEGIWHVIELGSGSAIPSLTLLKLALRGDTRTQNIRFTLCDYNEDVLKLCTMPNVLLSCPLEDILKTGEGEEFDIDLEAMAPYLNNSLDDQLWAGGRYY